MTEWLCEKLDLQPGMRVLDLGCGRALSSVFLAREFGVQVWATDLWIAATENLAADSRCANVTDRVFPIHADAHSLPFAAEFFDAITAIDCYSYFGTDDLYLNYLVQFVKPGGQIGIAGAGLIEEMPTPVPEHLRETWTQDFWCLTFVGMVAATLGADRASGHRRGRVDGEGWQVWSQWQRSAWPDNTAEIAAVEADAGRFLGYVRLVGKRREGIKLEHMPGQIRYDR